MKSYERNELCANCETSVFFIIDDENNNRAWRLCRCGLMEITTTEKEILTVSKPSNNETTPDELVKS